MLLDGAHAHVQGGGDLLVRAPSAASRRPAARSRSAPGWGRRPLIRRSSARVFSAHRRAPSCSKIASACSSASRAARLCAACLCTWPSASRLRPCSNSVGQLLVLGRACSNASSAPSRSPSAAASRPRQRSNRQSSAGSSGAPAPRTARGRRVPARARPGRSGSRSCPARSSRAGIEAGSDEPCGQLAQVGVGGVKVAQGELEVAQVSQREDPEELGARDRQRLPPVARACSTRPRCASTCACSCSAHRRLNSQPACSASSSAAAACSAHAAPGKPLKQRQPAEREHVRVLVPRATAPARPPRERPGPGQADPQTSGTCEDRPRALGQGKRPAQALLDRDSFLEQARRDLLRAPLRPPSARDRPRQQLRIADAPGPRKRGASVRERAPNVDLPQAILAQIAQDLRAQRVVAPASASASSPSLINVGRSPSPRPASVRSTSARSMPAGTSARSCSSIVRARSPLPARRWNLAACRRRRRPACASSGGSPPQAHTAPRRRPSPRDPPHARPPRPAQQQLSPTAHRRPAPGGGRAPPHPRLPRRGRGAPRGASTRRLPVADRGQQRVHKHEAASHPARARPPAQPPPPPQGHLPVTVRCGHQLDRRAGKRRHLHQHIQRLRRQRRQTTAEELTQALRNAATPHPAWARARPHQLRPSSSAKNGFPAVASRTRASSDGASSSQTLPQQPLQLGPAQRPSDNDVSRSSGRTRSSANGTPSRRPPQPSPAHPPAPRAAAARELQHRGDEGSSHCTSSSASTTGPHPATTRTTSRSASPIARASTASSPGSTSSNATSSARRRGGASNGATSSNTGATRSESPANASSASASTLR